MTETENNTEAVEETASFLEDVPDYSWTESPEAIEAMVTELAQQDEDDRFAEYMAPIFEEDLSGWFK